MAKAKKKIRRLLVDRVIHAWPHEASDEIIHVTLQTDRGKVRLSMMADCIREMNAAAAAGKKAPRAVPS